MHEKLPSLECLTTEIKACETLAFLSSLMHMSYVHWCSRISYWCAIPIVS